MSEYSHHSRRQQKDKRGLLLILLLFVVLFGILLASLFLTLRDKTEPDSGQTGTVTSDGTGRPAEDTGSVKEKEDEAQGQDKEKQKISTEIPSYIAGLQENDVWTFLQGPKAWAAKVDFSGSWCDVELAGQKFSVFGCGHCDLANIYNTLTPYYCSPLDMFDLAKAVSAYKPVSGYGAIDWPDLKLTLEAVGIDSTIHKKDASYEEFQQKVASSLSVIALVSSADNAAYWKEVEGHYVNLWLYNPEDDTVLLGDSGNPEHNRQRIPLRYVYDALKSSAKFQYLLVTGVDEAANTWKHDGINVDWKKPSYWNS